jgi:hypothetical protein
MTQDRNMFMTDQAVGAVMMALQKSLMEQSDIVPTLKEFKFKLSDNGLMVMNPPIVKFDDDFEEKNNVDGFDVAGDQPE